VRAFFVAFHWEHISDNYCNYGLKFAKSLPVFLNGSNVKGMTLSEFTRLDRKDQLNLTWDKGILHDHITHDRHYYLLYRLYDFFVELAFSAETNDIIGVSSFRS
jgi:hypothetical protein